MRLFHSVLLAFIPIFLSLSILVNAQQIAYTPEGRKVFLNEDGTWKIETSPEEKEKEEILVMKKYLAAVKWEDRLKHVREPEKIKSLMANRYQDFQGPNNYKEVVLLKDKEDGTKQVRVVYEGHNDYHDYYLTKTNQGYKVDWKASLGINENVTTLFQIEKPTTSKRFLAYGELATYYHYEFKGKEKAYWNIYLYASDGKGSTKGTFFGYLLRSSSQSDELIALLKDQEKHKLVVDLSYLPESRSKNCVLIDRIVSFDTWVEP